MAARVSAGLLSALVALAPMARPGAAAIVEVPADQPTIQLGIMSAAAGDTVLVAQGTYSEQVDFLGKPIVVGSWYLITGDPEYSSTTILDGGGTLGPLASFTSGEDSLSVLSGLTLRNGRATEGGGIRCRGASPRIAGCILQSNEATYMGGGLLAWQGSPLIEGCRFEGNASASSSGGGLAVWQGSPRILDSVLVGNTANVSGGAIFIEESAPIVCDNVIDGNEALGSYAGGIMSRNSTPVIARNVISDNHTNSGGGGVFY